ncbi:MAG: hypothetical protein DDT29_02285 [Dehalococcoidia bacterium]|nr:hypothetical protein [Bacillota bacterium]
MSKTLTLIVSIAIMALIIIGLINFDLFLELWVKLFIGVLFLGVLVTVVRRLFR